MWWQSGAETSEGEKYWQIENQALTMWLGHIKEKLGDTARTVTAELDIMNPQLR